MPRGRGGGPKKTHKGKSRHFTDPREIEQQETKEAKAKAWRKKKGLESDEEGEGEEGKEGKDGEVVNRRGAVGDIPVTDSGSGSESEEEEARPKGVEHLIEVHNPNRTGAKSSRKVTEMDASASTQLSRKEREELEKQESTRRYQQLHAEGKTDEARSDLARLALIKKQREDAAKKRESELKAKETSKKKS